MQLTGGRLREDGGNLLLAEISWPDASAALEAPVLNIQHRSELRLAIRDLISSNVRVWFPPTLRMNVM